MIDSNILIYHFADEIPAEEQDKIKSIFKKSFNISIIAKIEFLGWKRHTESGFKEAKEFLQKSRVIGEWCYFNYFFTGLMDNPAHKAITFHPGNALHSALPGPG